MEYPFTAITPRSTGWNDKIVILKKTTLQVYFKTFIEKMWASAESCYHTQGLPPAIWLHQGITTLFSTSRYTLVLTFKPTSKMWGGMMSLALGFHSTASKGSSDALSCALKRPDLRFEGAGNGPVVITWIGREYGLYSGASPISLVEHCVTFRHDRRLLSLLGFVHNWTTSRWSATKNENWFSLNGNGIMSLF